jgi:hypothetical protein
LADVRDFVELSAKRNRGWPWPEASYGLTPMHGEDGWCHSCGVALRSQCGSLVLQRKNFKVHGAWLPYWQYDAICLEAGLAGEIAGKFRVELIDVQWHASSSGEARQIVAPTVGGEWFDPDELRKRAVAEHSTPGATCAACGTWRWLPLAFEPIPPLTKECLPPVRNAPEFEEFDVVASPEWFGDGWNAFRQILVRRELAAMIVAASPRDFRIVEPSWA